ncbi:hypothetical protein ARMGADRAFT_37969 [Armillaria gallica]|uniref:Uncharacterized protein n=1 Tax=Armillaria gallica TaxID=47427 RepID=A0A2H3EWX1_ARMGA|nr:hypothetical protein ARMGADRAFT_37969 [Armillaria gallica]
MNMVSDKPDTVATIDVNLSRPRREIMWQGVGGNDINLDGISSQFKTAVSSLSFSLFSLEHIARTARGYRTVHRCPGYRREEVTLRPVLSDCKVIMHATPSLHEKCQICEKVVEEGQFNCKCGQPDDGISPTVKCTMCSVWGHRHCNDQSGYCWSCVVTASQNPAGPYNPLGHAPTSPLGATDGGMMEDRPHLLPNAIIPQFMRENQKELTRISNMLSQVKQEFLANRMATLGSVRVLPEERIANNDVFEQLHRATADLENKLPMLYLFANGKNDVWVKRLAVIDVVVQQQRNVLTSANPRFIVNLDNLRIMLSEVQKGHERFNAMVQTIIGQKYQHQQQPL